MTDITVNEYLTPDIEEKIADLKRKKQGTHYSDVVDAEGNQYVDVVMEGGAMLGIALVGYLYVLEEMGIRFRGIAGTSAGSIVALTLAAFGPPQQKKTTDILREIVNKDFIDFVDNWRVKKIARTFFGRKKKKPALGQKRAWYTIPVDMVYAIVTLFGRSKQLSRLAFEQRLKKAFSHIWLVLKAITFIPVLYRKWGVNSGKHFEQWMAGLLRRKGIQSIAELEAVMCTQPDGYGLRDPNEAFNKKFEDQMRLAIFASDTTTETVVELPKMAKLYWKNSPQLNPAKLVRASMSIPLLFEPLVVKGIPKSKNLAKKWDDYAGFNPLEGHGFPTDVVFVDGGVMSNFPIHAFHVRDAAPQAPTFGVKLSVDKRNNASESLVDVVMNTFNSARHTLDYRFIYQNPGYTQLFKPIDTRGFDALDFDMSTDDKKKLFAMGVAGAISFLEKFDWSAYKDYRKAVIAANAMLKN